MYITKELFVIPNGENFILYAPLKRAVAEVNGDMIHLLKRLDAGENIGDLERKLNTLKQIGIVTDGETPIAEYVPKKDYSPTTVTLIPSLDCNLRCVYCYANAGEGAGKSMDIEIAKSAVDFVIENARAKEEREVELGFHGGGEPFLRENIDIVKKAVEYFKEQARLYGLQTGVSGVTNGVISNNTLEWIVANFDELSISFDGPQDIQDKQRPAVYRKVYRKGSYSQVMKTISYLESQKFKYNLRSVITRSSVSRMPEIVEFFNSIAPSIDHFTLEPLFECGRCKTSNTEAPDPEDFIKYLIMAKEVASRYGKIARYGCSEIDGVYNYFCGAVNHGFFFVLPDGDVTSCLEVCRKSDSRIDVFRIGRYDSDAKRFVFYNDKIKTLRSRSVDQIPHCGDCFAKYNCAGDCPTRCYTQSGSLFDTSKNTNRCTMTQEIIKNNLIQILKGGNAKNDFRI